MIRSKCAGSKFPPRQRLKKEEEKEDEEGILD